MRVLLISTYELGHQPFGVASPAAWLAAKGADVTCLDLSRESLREEAVRTAGLIAFYVPMHTATRLSISVMETVRALNPKAHICFYGLYAPVNEAYLRAAGADTVLGGEFEEGLARLVDQLSSESNSHHTQNLHADPVISLARQKFIVPDRAGLPALARYAHLVMPDGSERVAGYTEASRGCKHLCRHCPIVPVYNGAFRVVERDVVLEDVRQQVSAGAQHVTFGDPDFFNGPSHAMAIVEALHREFPSLSYDVTIKIEHLLQHARYLPQLRETGCLFVTSAVEAVDDHILEQLDKGHTRADFLQVIEMFANIGLTLQPTFVPFTPWTTLEGYRDLLEVLAAQGLVENVTPIQLAIRLLIPEGSRILELDAIQRRIGAFDSAALYYPWQHGDAAVDALACDLRQIVERSEKLGRSRTQIFERLAARAWQDADVNVTAGGNCRISRHPPKARPGQPVPRLDEPWYCCAEPTQDQLVSIGCAKETARQPGAFV
jgi:radical SAM superfamily enzyme YgiQ (UPF0313 family)